MSKFQDHRYYYPIGALVGGRVHIGIQAPDTARVLFIPLCGASTEGQRAVKRLPDLLTMKMSMCPQCETKFRQRLAKSSKLIDAWA